MVRYKTLDDYMNELPPERRQKIEQEAAILIEQEHNLQELRKARHFSQQVVADNLNVKQAEVSKIERRTDMYVSTLRSFIEAMGGNLEIIARFKDGPPVRITQFAALDG